jgi:hypothetical protein
LKYRRTVGAEKLGGRVGRRGLALLFFGALDLAIAFGIFTIEDYPTAVAAAYAGQAAMFPLTAWAWVWAVTGAICILQAFARHDRAAFVLGAGVKMGWAAGFVIGFFFFDLQRAWLSMIIYLAFSGFVLMISGWQENHPTNLVVELDRL